MLTRRKTLAGLAAGTAALACSSVPAWSQNFTKQVHMIVPYGPGGTSDILARLIGPKLSAAIGQPVIVENKPSASGNIGADFVAKQAGDGHTLPPLPHKEFVNKIRTWIEAGAPAPE